MTVTFTHFDEGGGTMESPERGKGRGSSAGGTRFITAVSWVFLILGGMATLGSALQTVLVLTVFSDAPEIASEVGLEGMRGFAFQYPRTIALSALAFSGSALLAAIGLLRRREWARRLMVIVLGLGVAYAVGSAVFQWMYFKDVMSQIPPGARSFYIHTRNGALVVATVIGGVAAWLAMKLSSAQIRAEFR